MSLVIGENAFPIPCDHHFYESPFHLNFYKLIGKCYNGYILHIDVPKHVLKFYTKDVDKRMKYPVELSVTDLKFYLNLLNYLGYIPYTDDKKTSIYKYLQSFTARLERYHIANLQPYMMDLIYINPNLDNHRRKRHKGKLSSLFKFKISLNDTSDFEEKFTDMYDELRHDVIYFMLSKLDQKNIDYYLNDMSRPGETGLQLLGSVHETLRLIFITTDDETIKTKIYNVYKVLIIHKFTDGIYYHEPQRRTIIKLLYSRPGDTLNSFLLYKSLDIDNLKNLGMFLTSIRFQELLSEMHLYIILINILYKFYDTDVIICSDLMYDIKNIARYKKYTQFDTYQLDDLASQLIYKHEPFSSKDKTITPYKFYCKAYARMRNWRFYDLRKLTWETMTYVTDYNIKFLEDNIPNYMKYVNLTFEEFIDITI